ncbi:hypothetical protein ACLBKU_07165 [Erythrobacter sp. NE805]|uniref:hypothetical protein n=1 Tax=Erythrobacter sp. NE805 TaxID=3389875 RepID=UPI00396B3287
MTDSLADRVKELKSWFGVELLTFRAEGLGGDEDKILTDNRIDEVLARAERRWA